jgi:hypothetical protein
MESIPEHDERDRGRGTQRGRGEREGVFSGQKVSYLFMFICPSVT